MAVIENVPRIGVLVLNRNGRHWLNSIFQSLREEKYPNKQIFLIDNASTDGSVEMTVEKYPEVTTIRLPQNLGYCMAYNLAMPYAFAAGCEWVIWANNDIRLEPGCLGTLVNAAQSDALIGVLSPAFLAWDSDEPNYYMLGNHPHAIPAMKSHSCKPINVDWVEGSFLMVSRRCLERVGPLDPYLYFYWEEADFCRRARYQGWRVVLVPGALARHYAGGWSNGDPQNIAKATLLQARNHYIYQLANPLQNFLINLVDVVHLFLVNLKNYFPNKICMVKLHLRIFARVLGDLGIIHGKWYRDRKIDHPPETTGAIQSIRVEVIQGQI